MAGRKMTMLSTEIGGLGDQLVAALGIVEWTAEYQRIERLYRIHQCYLR